MTAPTHQRPEGPGHGALATVIARGSLALLLRQVVAFTASFGTSLLFARALSPADLGMIAIFLMIVGVGRLLVDFGLSYSLIRQDAPPTDDELAGVLGSQLSIAGIITLGCCLVTLVLPAPFPSWFSAEGTFLVTASLLAFAPASVATALIERRLDFATLGRVTLIQPVVFALASCLAVYVEPSATSVAIALACSLWVPVPVMMRVAGRRIPLPRVRLRETRRRLRFSAPIVSGSLVSQAKDSVNPIFIPWVLGIAAAGYITWAQQLAAVATYALYALSSVYFPIFARVRHDRERLQRVVGLAAFWSSVLVAPVACALLANADALVQVVYGDQWDTAIPTLRLLLFANLLSPAAAVLIAAFNAEGRPGIGLAYSVVWAVATWILVPCLAPPWGIEGYGVANILVTLASVGLLVQGRSILTPGGLVRSGVPWVCAGLAAGTALLAVRATGLATAGAAGVTLYAVVLLVVYGCVILVWCHGEVQQMRRALVGR